jgi:hypothetical protein
VHYCLLQRASSIPDAIVHSCQCLIAGVSRSCALLPMIASSVTSSEISTGYLRRLAQVRS